MKVLRSSPRSPWKTRFRAAAVAMLTVLAVGCTSEQPEWNGKNIEGVMPDLEFELTATNGKQVQADDYAGQVRLMFFGFTSCPDVCPATLAYLQNAINKMPESLQDKITTLFVSVDPNRDTPEKLEQYVAFFGDHIEGLTAPEETLRQLAKRYRTTFGYGEADDKGNYQVSHSSAIYVFDHTGHIRLLLRSDLPVEQVTEDLTQLAELSVQ